MDEIYNMMESGEAAVAAYYAGDYFTHAAMHRPTAWICSFYYPENTNYFIDAMCIPSKLPGSGAGRDASSTSCSAAEAAVANAEYIYYASPNSARVRGSGAISTTWARTPMAILYPDIGSFRDAYNRSAYRNLDQDTLTYVNSLWETLKIN